MNRPVPPRSKTHSLTQLTQSHFFGARVYEAVTAVFRYMNDMGEYANYLERKIDDLELDYQDAIDRASKTEA